MKTNLNISILVVACCTWLAVLNPAFAQSWSLTSAPSNTWTSVATSADGTRLIAVGASYIYTSTNYGAAWVSNTAPNIPWTSVASSADGTKLVATGGGAVYTNSGTTWTFAYASPKSGPSYEQDIDLVACSADGSKVVAAASFGDPIYSPKPFIYVSTDTGAIWASVTNAPSDGQGWLSVASSASGAIMAASMLTGGLFTSANTGTTWTSNSVPSFSSLAMSADGTHLFGASPLGLFYSANSGVAWTPQITGPVITNRIACSTNGLVLYGLSHSNIYSSFNGGNTWATNTASATNWTAIAVSKDGVRAVAAASGRGIYVLNPPPLMLGLSSGTVSLLWSTNYAAVGFSLMQNTNLLGASWITVPNLPTVNGANYQVTLPATNRQAFFRLQSP